MNEMGDEEHKSSLEQVSNLMARWDGERFHPRLTRSDIGACIAALETVAANGDELIARSAAGRLLPLVEDIHLRDHGNLGGDSTRHGWQGQMEAFGESLRWLDALTALTATDQD